MGSAWVCVRSRTTAPATFTHASSLKEPRQPACCLAQIKHSEGNLWNDCMDSSCSLLRGRSCGSLNQVPRGRSIIGHTCWSWYLSQTQLKGILILKHCQNKMLSSQDTRAYLVYQILFLKVPGGYKGIYYTEDLLYWRTPPKVTGQEITQVQPVLCESWYKHYCEEHP